MIRVSKYVLIPISSYIGWREQNYPGFNKDTVSLLQNCLVHFKDMKEFHQNEKYVQLWIKMVFKLINFYIVYFISGLYGVDPKLLKSIFKSKLTMTKVFVSFFIDFIILLSNQD